MAFLLCLPDREAREHILQENSFYKRSPHGMSLVHAKCRACTHARHTHTHTHTVTHSHTLTHSLTHAHTRICSHAHARMNAVSHTAATTLTPTLTTTLTTYADQHLAGSAMAQEHVSKAQRAGYQPKVRVEYLLYKATMELLLLRI
jgi:hypothetical protein